MSEKDSGTKVPSNGDIHRQKGALKTARIPIKIQPAEKLPKPGWIRVKAGSYSSHFHEVKNLLKEQELVTVCDEATPNALVMKRVVRTGENVTGTGQPLSW